jgi:type II secretory ATPase GspE/PulE/Tfp pilus assembly ATPase PilB-like protein
VTIKIYDFIFNMYSIQLTHPFGLLVSGNTKSGKTIFVKKLLSYVNVMIDKPPENIVMPSTKIRLEKFKI